MGRDECDERDGKMRCGENEAFMAFDAIATPPSAESDDCCRPLRDVMARPAQ